LSSAVSGIAQKVQIRFSKTGALRFLSHHDMMRLFARACRRAQLPVRLTEGFDPRPRLVFATALELGIEAHAESLEIELSRWVRPERVRSALSAELPKGVEVSETRLLPPRRAGNRVVEMTFRVTLPGGPVAQGLTSQTLSAMLEREELIFERPRHKRIQKLDLRPSLLSLEIDGDELILRLQPSPGGTARPAEILSLLTSKPLTETKRWPTKKTAMHLAP
jgi:radical SAM-linked protein